MNAYKDLDLIAWSKLIYSDDRLNAYYKDFKFKGWYFNLAFMFKRENGKYHFKGIVSKRLVKELEND